jgi:hypothetical protein
LTKSWLSFPWNRWKWETKETTWRSGNVNSPRNCELSASVPCRCFNSILIDHECDANKLISNE